MLKYVRIAVTALSLLACVLLIPIGTPELVIIGIIVIILFVGSQFPPVGGAKAPK